MIRDRRTAMTLRARSRRVMSPAPFARSSQSTVTRRARAALVVGAVFGAGFAVPSEAAPPFRTLVFRARANASLDITFPRSVTLDGWKIQTTGGRNYVGFYLQPLTGKPDAGAGAVRFHGYRIPGFTWAPLPVGVDDGWAFTSDSTTRTLPAGRYRLHVLADAPAEVRIPVVGFTAKPLHATRPTRVSHLVKDVTSELVPRVPGGTATPGAARADLPFTVPSERTISFASLQVLRHGHRSTAGVGMGACINTEDHPHCMNEQNDQFDGYKRGEHHVDVATQNGKYEDTFVRYYFPSGKDPAGAGDQRAYYLTYSTANIDRVVVTAMSLAL